MMSPGELIDWLWNHPAPQNLQSVRKTLPCHLSHSEFIGMFLTPDHLRLNELWSAYRLLKAFHGQRPSSAGRASLPPVSHVAFVPPPQSSGAL